MSAKPATPVMIKGGGGVTQEYPLGYTHFRPLLKGGKMGRPSIAGFEPSIKKLLQEKESRHFRVDPDSKKRIKILF